jgi:hypothetical protein
MKSFNIPVRIKDFANYSGRHRHTAAKMYRTYLEIVGKRPWHALTVSDIAKVDDLKPQQVFDLMYG